MRGLKLLTAVLGVLIVLGTTVVVVTIARRLIVPAATPVGMPAGTHVGTPVAWTGTVLLDEPSGTRIAAIVTVGDRLALQLQGGGPDRVLLLDPRSGAIMGRVALSR